MLEKLKELRTELAKREARAHGRMCRKKGLDNPSEACRQEGKWVAYRNAGEMLDALIAEYEEVDEWAEYDEPHYPFEEAGYDPYAGGFDPDL